MIDEKAFDEKERAEQAGETQLNIIEEVLKVLHHGIQDLPIIGPYYAKFVRKAHEDTMKLKEGVHHLEEVGIHRLGTVAHDLGQTEKNLFRNLQRMGSVSHGHGALDGDDERQERHSN